MTAARHAWTTPGPGTALTAPPAPAGSRPIDRSASPARETSRWSVGGSGWFRAVPQRARRERTGEPHFRRLRNRRSHHRYQQRLRNRHHRRSHRRRRPVYDSSPSTFQITTPTSKPTKSTTTGSCSCMPLAVSATDAVTAHDSRDLRSPIDAPCEFHRASANRRCVRASRHGLPGRPRSPRLPLPVAVIGRVAGRRRHAVKRERTNRWWWWRPGGVVRSGRLAHVP